MYIKQTVDQIYLETSYVNNEGWTKPSPVTLPHFTWMTDVLAAFNLVKLVNQLNTECILPYEKMIFSIQIFHHFYRRFRAPKLCQLLKLVPMNSDSCLYLIQNLKF